MGRDNVQNCLLIMQSLLDIKKMMVRYMDGLGRNLKNTEKKILVYGIWRKTMSDKNFLVGDTVWFYIRKHDFMSKGIIKEIFILDEIPFALIRNGHMETKMPISQIFHDDLKLIAWIEKEEKANVKRIKDNIHDAKELVELMYSVIEDCEFMPVADLNDKKIAIKERAKEIFDVKIK